MGKALKHLNYIRAKSTKIGKITRQDNKYRIFWVYERSSNSLVQFRPNFLYPFFVVIWCIK